MNDEENQKPLDLAINKLDSQSDDLAKRANDAKEEAERKAEILFQCLYRLAIDDNNKATSGPRIFSGELDGEKDPEALRQLVKIANRRAGQLWKLSTSGRASEALIFHRAELLEAVMNWVEEKIENYEKSTGELFEPTDAGLTFFNYSDLCPYEELPTPVERLLIPEKYIFAADDKSILRSPKGYLPNWKDSQPQADHSLPLQVWKLPARPRRSSKR